MYTNLVPNTTSRLYINGVTDYFLFLCVPILQKQL